MPIQADTTTEYEPANQAREEAMRSLMDGHDAIPR
jgi:hypothetical protein